MSIVKNTLAISCAILCCVCHAQRQTNPDAKLHRFSTTIEKERPQLDEETKRLISACQRNPSKENLAALRKQIEKNYDAVVARKKAKLEELKRTARHQSKVQEMQDIVDEMLQNRDARIEQNMRRFTDKRLRPGARTAQDGFLPVLGAGEKISISYAPVTNEEYARIIKATGRKAPKNWSNGNYLAGKAKHPVVNVTYNDAVAYCKWLTQKDGKAIYRLPTELEWEYAAGHMPKDADFNCGENKGTTAVDAYKKTLSASGAIDMWGNCWEWTSTPNTKNKNQMAIKGGSWKSKRTDCRTELKGIGHNPANSADDVSFRIVRVK